MICPRCGAAIETQIVRQVNGGKQRDVVAALCSSCEFAVELIVRPRDRADYNALVKANATRRP